VNNQFTIFGKHDDPALVFLDPALVFLDRRGSLVGCFNLLWLVELICFGWLL
jgi:hypothetical protein